MGNSVTPIGSGVCGSGGNKTDLSASEPQRAVVKPLVWVDDPDHSKGLTSAVGYDIWDFDDGPCLVSYSVVKGSFETIEAAALADYEARILSAITLRTEAEAEVRAETWAAALERAAEIMDREHASCEVLRLTHNQRDVSLEAVSSWFANHAAAIRALITDDASAALDRIKAEAKAEGMREAAGICVSVRNDTTLTVFEANIASVCASAILAAIPEVRK